MTLVEFENLLAVRIAAEAGLAAGKVIWADQARSRPARSFIELDYLDEAGDEHSEQSVVPNPAFDPLTDTTNTQAIFLKNTDHTDIEIEVRAFTTNPKDARKMLRDVRNKLGGERAQDALGEVALITRGNVRDLSTVLDNETEGRAVMALKFRLAETNSEDAGIIEIVEVETTIERTNDTVTKLVTLQ